MCAYAYMKEKKDYGLPGIKKKTTFLRFRVRILKANDALSLAKKREKRTRGRGRKRSEKDAPRLLKPATTEEAPLDRIEVVVDIILIILFYY